MKATGLLITMMGATLALTAFVAARESAPADDASDARLAAVEKRLAGVEKLLREVRETGRSVKRRVDSAPRAAAPNAVHVPPSAAPVGALRDGLGDAHVSAFEQEVASRVESAVERKMEQMAARTRHRGQDGKWKPPIAEMTTALGLNADQERTLRTIFDGARDEAMALLNEERPGGGSLLEEFADDIVESGDMAESAKRFFTQIMTAKVPGRDQTYLSAFEELGSRIAANVEAQLDEEGRREFRALKVDVFDVKTGYDPVGDFIKARLAEQD